MTIDPLQFIQENIYANFEKGNIEGVIAVFSDQIKFNHHGPRELIPFAGEWNGKAEAAQMLGIFAETTEPVFVNPTAMFANGDKVVVLINESYRVKATGKSYVIDVAHVWTLRDNQVVQFDELYDSCAVAEAFREDA